MIRQMAFILGAVFLLIGVLGFVPGATTDGMLLGLFHVNPAHNFVHLLSGVVAVVAGLSGGSAPLWFFRVFGIIYGLVAILGFIGGNEPVLGMIANNRADVWLHALLSVVSLILGFLPIGHLRHAHA
jgi:hypothetical protein